MPSEYTHHMIINYFSQWGTISFSHVFRMDGYAWIRYARSHGFLEAARQSNGTALGASWLKVNLESRTHDQFDLLIQEVASFYADGAMVAKGLRASQLL